MDLAALNQATRAEAVTALRDCCASSRWAEAMADRRPFSDPAALLTAAADEWWVLSEDHWSEAFAAHPDLGASVAGDDRHHAWSRVEQSGAAGAPQDVAAALAECNRAYRDRFGRGFLICATGLDAAAMVAACRRRLDNEADEELLVAAAEQEKITALRLRRLLGID